ncbi:hypothetical protein MF271_19525 (plasmid) [Deinococcus sp. KNUC1210]|uniref:hypothetical protein n=1 Tax=Deinococcus sp. KNUC1210 TaxID=2917691 RepID=UPI001EEFA4C1|nr:hypothetical protein [Deinococcus sp. KNUC1210]ULH17383.1 hypothetical protein MF271_19525 [Deinococcus sp. KNUC1210]
MATVAEAQALLDEFAAKKWELTSEAAYARKVVEQDRALQELRAVITATSAQLEADRCVRGLELKPGEQLYVRRVTRGMTEASTPMTEEEVDTLPFEEMWLASPPVPFVRVEYLPVENPLAEALAVAQTDNQALRMAVEFYAEPAAWDWVMPVVPGLSPNMPPAHHDGGHLARTTLAAISTANQTITLQEFIQREGPKFADVSDAQAWVRKLRGQEPRGEG